MLAVLSLAPILLVAVWLMAEMRGQRRARIALGILALISVAVVAFFWGGFAEAMRHVEWPVPHDTPENIGAAANSAFPCCGVQKT
jgi:4-amino-4-deoxy-L-arabinose transferase-like glycosyltransferase